MTKLLITQVINILYIVSKTVEKLRQDMSRFTALLPEYPVVIAMRSVGVSLDPKLMAETRFAHRGFLVAFAGIRPGANQSQCS